MLKDKNDNIIPNNGHDQDTIIINNTEYDYTFSPNNMMIERDGIQYANAIDPLNSNRIYIETDTPITTSEESENLNDYLEAWRIVSGEETENDNT